LRWRRRGRRRRRKVADTKQCSDLRVEARE
jgi:hypothetical protein